MKTALTCRNKPMTLDTGFDRLFDDFFEGFHLVPFGRLAGDLEPVFNPKINVSESEKEIKISAELPGIDESDINVEMDEDVLTISGEKKTETEDKDQNRHHIERHYGSFKRVIPLTARIDAEKTTAEFKKGVLDIKLPKLPEETPKSKRIKIKAA